ncbi:hypothetical protein POX_d05415 [Penicillium oxalicum]|uniref:Uncharacterized protein n=1 Tax=Penicillium oxalicum (strain 114-2 / CGMCC 5302) TaxID=933388 RepID=S8BC16_PENO1|nr:hypothetical protein POX_d05415 [Penicillium oxalicum]EPS32422.1 hypothetical protein PDE_07382 [Penicillium oxalicum 114-2]KAI2789916.1 hypothetical protein POX_d05415 [Penicillium oxalicum]
MASYKPTHGAGQSSVGTNSLYEAGDQRNEPQSVLNERERYAEGKEHSHKNLDSKDERSIANKLAAQSKKSDPSHHHNGAVDQEAELSKKDPTAPAKLHGNAPSKGAKIDAELQAEDEQRLREKGIKK